MLTARKAINSTSTLINTVCVNTECPIAYPMHSTLSSYGVPFTSGQQTVAKHSYVLTIDIQ